MLWRIREPLQHRGRHQCAPHGSGRAFPVQRRARRAGTSPGARSRASDAGRTSTSRAPALSIRPMAVALAASRRGSPSTRGEIALGAGHRRSPVDLGDRHRLGPQGVGEQPGAGSHRPAPAHAAGRRLGAHRAPSWHERHGVAGGGGVGQEHRSAGSLQRLGLTVQSLRVGARPAQRDHDRQLAPAAGRRRPGRRGSPGPAPLPGRGARRARARRRAGSRPPPGRRPRLPGAAAAGCGRSWGAPGPGSSRRRRSPAWRGPAGVPTESSNHAGSSGMLDAIGPSASAAITIASSHSVPPENSPRSARPLTASPGCPPG